MFSCQRQWFTSKDFFTKVGLYLNSLPLESLHRMRESLGKTQESDTVHNASVHCCSKWRAAAGWKLGPVERRWLAFRGVIHSRNDSPLCAQTSHRIRFVHCFTLTIVWRFRFLHRFRINLIRRRCEAVRISPQRCFLLPVNRLQQEIYTWSTQLCTAWCQQNEVVWTLDRER